MTRAGKMGIAALLLALLTGGMWLTRRPSAEAGRRSQEQERRAVELESASAHLARLKAERQQLETGIAQHVTRLPSTHPLFNESPEQGAQFIHEVARRHRLTVVALSWGKLVPTEPGLLCELPFVAGVEGKYSDLVSFLDYFTNALSRSSGDVLVKDLSIRYAPKDAGGRVHASFTLAVVKMLPDCR